MDPHCLKFEHFLIFFLLSSAWSETKWEMRIHSIQEIFYQAAVFELDHRDIIQWNWVLDFEADGIGGLFL